MGSFAANITNSISPTAQALFDELWIAFIAPLDFPDVIISVVAVSAAIIAVHLLLDMVRDLKQMTNQKKKNEYLGVRRDFSTGNPYVNAYFVIIKHGVVEYSLRFCKINW